MTPRAVSRALLVLTAVGLSYATVALVATAERSDVLTMYAAASPPSAAAFLTAGLALITAGALAMNERATGSLCILAGVAWFAPALVGWEGGPPLVRGIGMVLTPFLLPVLVHLAMAVPAGRLGRARRRGVLAAAYGFTALGSLGLALTRDPFLDVHCWSNCTDNIFVLVNDPGLARLIGQTRLIAAVAIGLVTVLAASWQLYTATAVARALGWTVTLPAALATGVEASYAATLLRDPAEDPQQDQFALIFLVRALALTALAAGVGWHVWQRHRRRAAFDRLVDELEASPESGSLQASLSTSFGDDSLTVAYWLPGEQRYVTPSGNRWQPETDPTRATTFIVRGGEQVAVISNERGTVDEETLRRRVGPAAQLAIDNERLAAELCAHLSDLRASRTRVVTAADETRRRIERDLHDGAQQRLLAVLFELRLAHQAGTDPGARPPVLEAMIDGVQQSLAELRELARGIFPAILDESGLGPAMQTLADQAAVPVCFDAVPDGRLPAAAERGAYLVLSETLAATEPADGLLRVSVAGHADTVVVEIAGHGHPPTEYLSDRIGAAGGTLTYANGTIRAEIPCG